MMMLGRTPQDGTAASHGRHPDDDCDDCVADKGLCSLHARSVLPALRQPSWHRQAHSGMYRELGGPQEPSPEARLVILRKERKRVRRLQLFADLLAKPDAA